MEVVYRICLCKLDDGYIETTTFHRLGDLIAEISRQHFISADLCTTILFSNQDTLADRCMGVSFRPQSINIYVQQGANSGASLITHTKVPNGHSDPRSFEMVELNDNGEPVVPTVEASSSSSSSSMREQSNNQPQAHSSVAFPPAETDSESVHSSSPHSTTESIASGDPEDSSSTPPRIMNKKERRLPRRLYRTLRHYDVGALFPL